MAQISIQYDSNCCIPFKDNHIKHYAYCKTSKFGLTEWIDLIGGKKSK